MEANWKKPGNGLRICRPAGEECSKRQFYQYLRFYQLYPQIVRAVTAQLRHLFPESDKIQYKLAGINNK